MTEWRTLGEEGAFVQVLGEAAAVQARENERLREAIRQALSFVTGAIEETGEDEDDLIARPETMWVRMVCARDVLRVALAEATDAS